MNAEERALRRLSARGRFGIRLGLGRTRALLRAMGSPEQGLRGALIGGTNGKGSVQALVAAVLRETGLRVGQTPKPHLVSYRERILIDGVPIEPDAFAALVDETLDTAEAMSSRLGPTTEFEILTAAAFTWFARQAVQVGVVEVGLGGRLDATNAWDGGVAAITTVGLDHMEHLGPTVVHIAREKAAIIKRGDRAVSGVTGAGARPIRRRARALHVPLIETSPLLVRSMDRDGLVMEAPGLGLLHTPLLGRHQAHNAAVAIGTLEALAAAGTAQAGSEDIRRGFAAVRWPGRLELVKSSLNGPDVLLDGAHNPEGAAALADALGELRPLLAPGRPTVLVAVMADKDVPGILGPMARLETLRDARIIATTVPDAARSMDVDLLARAWRAAGGSSAWPQELRAIPDGGDALDAALDAARADAGPLVCFGSLYLVGHVRARLLPGD